MRSRVYATVERPSVRPSVCHIDRQQQRRASGLLLGARRQEMSIDRHRRSAATAPQNGAEQQTQRQRHVNNGRIYTQTVVIFYNFNIFFFYLNVFYAYATCKYAKCRGLMYYYSVVHVKNASCVCMILFDISI